ncbi:MAG: saccharopine dehydrogenase NADP-binding domain-containing protein [Chloroflexota bacterium]
MTKILILGGYGYTGRLIARHLLKESNAKIVLAGRNPDKAQALADQLNSEFSGKRVTTECVDAAEAHSLRAALNGVDMLLVAAPTTQYAETVIHTAMETRVDYLDVQISAKKLAVLRSLSGEFEKAGLCYITEAGFHPGLPSAMVRLAAGHFDRIENAITACYLNLGPNLPYSEAVDELMEAFKEYRGEVYKEGRWTKSGSYNLRKIDFGGELGIRTCYSMFFEELSALPEMYPSLKEVGFYISESHWLVDWVINTLVMLALKIAPTRAVRPFGKFLWWGMQTFPKPPYRVELLIEAFGMKDGQLARYRTSIKHADGYELTAIPVVACLLQYLDGSARKPGLWMMGHLVEPVRLMDDMQRMGIEVSTTIQAV